MNHQYQYFTQLFFLLVLAQTLLPILDTFAAMLKH